MDCCQCNRLVGDDPAATIERDGVAWKYLCHHCYDEGMPEAMLDYYQQSGEAERAGAGDAALTWRLSPHAGKYRVLIEAAALADRGIDDCYTVDLEFMVPRKYTMAQLKSGEYSEDMKRRGEVWADFDRSWEGHLTTTGGVGQRGYAARFTKETAMAIAERINGDLHVPYLAKSTHTSKAKRATTGHLAAP